MGSCDQTIQRRHIKIASNRRSQSGIHGQCHVLFLYCMHHSSSHLSHLLYSFDIWSLQGKSLVPLALDHRNLCLLVSLPWRLLLIHALIWWPNPNHSSTCHCHIRDCNWVLFVAVYYFPLPNSWLRRMETWEWKFRLGNETKILNNLQLCTYSRLEENSSELHISRMYYEKMTNNIS